MAQKTKYRSYLRHDDYELPDKRQPGEKRVILAGKIFIDRSIFSKSRKEKDILKAAKLQWKYDKALKR